MKRRITDELSTMKGSKFPDIADRDFEDTSGVSRASLPGVESGKAWPSIETAFLWTTACGSSLAELFRSPSGQYSEETRELHSALELILRSDPDHWLWKAIAREANYFKPARSTAKKARPPNPSGRAAEGDRVRSGQRHGTA